MWSGLTRRLVCFSVTWPSADSIKASSSAHTLAHYCTQCHFSFSEDQTFHHLSRKSLHTINIKSCIPYDYYVHYMVQCVPKVGSIVSVWPLMSPYSIPVSYMVRNCVCSILYNSQKSIAVRNNTKLAKLISAYTGKMCTNRAIPSETHNFTLNRLTN